MFWLGFGGGVGGKVNSSEVPLLEQLLNFPLRRGLVRLKPDGCTHHHRNRKNLVGKGKAAEGLGYLNEFGLWINFMYRQTSS